MCDQFQAIVAVVFVVVAPLNAGCSCMYTAAERKVTLDRPSDREAITTALRLMPGVQDVRDGGGESRKALFLFPYREETYHYFRWDDQLHGEVTHQEGGRTLWLRAFEWNHSPDAATKRRADLLLDGLQDRMTGSEWMPDPAH